MYFLVCNLGEYQSDPTEKKAAVWYMLLQVTLTHKSNDNTITQHVHVASWCSLQLVSCEDHCILLIFCWSSMGHTRLLKVSYSFSQKYHSKEEF